MIYRKLGMTLFLFAIVLAMLASTFKLQQNIAALKDFILIMLGIFVGLINIQEFEEKSFVLSGTAFVVCSSLITNNLTEVLLFSDLGGILNNLILFVAAATIVVALKLVFSHACDNKSVHPKHVHVHRRFKFKHARTWNIIVLIAIAIVFVSLVLESFFMEDPLMIQYGYILRYLDTVVVIVYIIDAIILYRAAPSWHDFIRDNWLDLLALLPLGMVFQSLKMVRVARLIRIIRIHRFSKFFSESSGFNELLDTLPTEQAPRRTAKKAKKRKGTGH